MNILTHTAATFKQGGKSYAPPVGQVVNAPDWIIYDPHFWLLYDHEERAKDYPNVSGMNQLHPQGVHALIKVIGDQPKKPDGLQIPGPSNPINPDAMNINSVVADLDTPLSKPAGATGLILPATPALVEPHMLTAQELEVVAETVTTPATPDKTKK